ncbi:MAG TPA: TetR/AcrR family transcriptional regulator [Kouleothrix sp.]|uniref:TetR/AcrR family transcriptional regulator n=1 Tax=Kouleothrix sp. TaxID=2779161 RepID=UPI002C9A8ACA|nr:TetR/AcrR family transcriptional regulator [Kouleothrix sp.]HRC75144.1 TetR/AcrR family transcriptional regulator [Kouleothrix sp.]
MKTEQTDRRVRRTRHLLTDALLALMRERQYGEITVQDILDRADVGRSTFYAHFYDKDDLLMSGFERLHSLFDLPADQSAPVERFSLVFFRHTAQHQAEYRAIVGSRGGEHVLRRVEQFLAERLAERLARIVPGEAADARLRSIATLHCASTLFELLAWWFEQKQPYSPEQMSALYATLVLPGLCELLKIERAPAERLL